MLGCLFETLAAMVVLQVDVDRVLLVEGEGDPPVAGHIHREQSGLIPF